MGIEPTVSSSQGWRITAFLPPDEWTAGELNPDFLGANQVSFQLDQQPKFFSLSVSLSPCLLVSLSDFRGLESNQH